MTFRWLFLSIAFLTTGADLPAGQVSSDPYDLHQRVSSLAEQKMVVIDAVAKGPTEIAIEELKALGLQAPVVIGKLISGILPIQTIPAAESLPSVNQISINRTITAVGDLTSEGDTALRSASARQSFNVDGSGISVAVISDSYNCLGGEENDRAVNDLPAQTTIIQEALLCNGLVDEGRAIMHLIHDIAPGARLLFLSGTNGYAGTANGILDLVNKHKVDIIVDDAKSLAAPFFQKGVLTQAVEQAVARGVTYITAAGNSERLSYEGAYRNSYNPSLDLNAHDFDPGAGTDIYQRIEIPEGAAISLIFQWESPAFSVSGTAGAVTDLDIRMINSKNESIVAQSASTNLGKDPIEVLEFYNRDGSGQTEFDLLISKTAGPDPGLIKYILFNRFDGRITEYHSKGGTIFGHANSEAVITVGAGNYQETPAFGYPDPLLEYFSSAGGTPWLFDGSGRKLTAVQIPDKPDLIAPDNVNTKFDLGEDTDGDGNSNFRGTSAAAPHVAGVAALMLQANRHLQPKDVMGILQLTAVDVRYRNNAERTFIGEEYDLDSGYGLVDAHKAVSMAAGFNSNPATPHNDTPSEMLVAHQATSGTGTFDLSIALLMGFVCWLISLRSKPPEQALL